MLSAGAAAMSLVLAAHALGYGANWITEWYAYDRGALDALGLKPHERIAGFVHIGRPPGPPEDRPRPPLDEIATRFSSKSVWIERNKIRKTLSGAPGLRARTELMEPRFAVPRVTRGPRCKAY